MPNRSKISSWLILFTVIIITTVSATVPASASTSLTQSLGTSGDATASSHWIVQDAQIIQGGNSDLLWRLPVSGVGLGDSQSFWQITPTGAVNFQSVNFTHGSGWQSAGLLTGGATGSNYAVWIKPGTEVAKLNTGDTIAFWILSSTGRLQTKGVDYARGSGWQVEGDNLNADGTITVFWVNFGTRSKSGKYLSNSLTTTLFNSNGQLVSNSPVRTLGLGWFASVFPRTLTSNIYTVEWAYCSSPQSQQKKLTAITSAAIWKLDRFGGLIAVGPVYTLGQNFSLIPMLPQTTDQMGNVALIWQKVDSTGTGTATVWKIDSTGRFVASSSSLSLGNGNMLSYADMAHDGSIVLTWRSVTVEQTPLVNVVPWTLRPNLKIRGLGKSFTGFPSYVPSSFVYAIDGSLRLSWIGSSGYGIWSFDSKAQVVTIGTQYKLPVGMNLLGAYFDSTNDVYDWFGSEGKAMCVELDPTGANIFTSPIYFKN